MGYGSYEETLNAIEGALSKGKFLVGDKFTAADLFVGSHLAFGMQFGTIEKRPTFERYVASWSDRPARTRATKIDDELMAKMKK